MTSRISVLLVLSTVSLLAQRVSGPVVGYVSSGATLQPVLGVRGAAILGDAIPVDASLTMLAVSPSQEYFLTSSADSGELSLTSTETGESRSIKGAMAGAGRAVMSPNGAAALLGANGRVQVVTGLPDAPVAGPSTDVSSIGAISALAISADGSLALLAAGEGSDAALYSVSADAGLRWLGPLGQDVRLAFSNRGRSAVIGGVSSNEMWVLGDVSGDFAPRRIAGPENGVAGLVGVAFSDDNRRVIAAHSGGVTRVQLDDSSTDVAACACTPTTLLKVRGDSAFRLTETGAGPMWIVDGGSPTAHVWFVPPKAPAADGGNE